MAAKLHNISDMTKQFSFFYFNYSTFLSYHTKREGWTIHPTFSFSLSMHAISSILCHCGTRYSKCGSYRCQYCRCKIPQKLYQPCFVLLSHFSTDFHRLIFKFIITDFRHGNTRSFCPQIITDYFFWHGNPRLYFYKDTAWLRIDIIHTTS